MSCKKSLLLLIFLAMFAVSGCEKKTDENKANAKPIDTSIVEQPSKPDIVSMPVTEQPSEPDVASAPQPVEETTGSPVTEMQKVVEKTEVSPVLEAQTSVSESAKDIISAKAEGTEILIADFEGWPNNLGGEMGVYGSLEPDWDNVAAVPYSWVYETITPGYDPKNVHGGRQSFRLVNCLGAKPELTWGSFAMDLGPTLDLTVVPKRVKSLDVSGYEYFTFWAKGEKGGEKMELLIRDAHALNYMPQVKYKLPNLTTEWQKIVVPLRGISGGIDLARLDNIGIAFGKDVSNTEGSIAYIDDFLFTNNP